MHILSTRRIDAIEGYVDHHNENPQLFIQTTKAVDIVQAATRVAARSLSADCALP